MHLGYEEYPPNGQVFEGVRAVVYPIYFQITNYTVLKNKTTVDG